MGTSSLASFAEKYQLYRHADELKSAMINYTEEAYNTANTHAQHLSQLSILFRNTIVQYQKTVQVFLDAAIKVLRETRFRLPGSKEMTTLPQVLKKLTSSIGAMLERLIQRITLNVEHAYNVMIDVISNIQVTMPIGDVMSGSQIIEEIKNTVKTTLNHIVDLVRHMESLDMILVKLGESLKAIVDKAQVFVDNTLKSDTLDVIAIYINGFYGQLVHAMKTITDYANTVLDMKFVNDTIVLITDVVASVVNNFYFAISDFVDAADFKAYVTSDSRRLVINLPFYLRQ